MFEELSPGSLIGVIEDSHREESIVIARRLSAIAALLCHRIGEAEDAPDNDDPGYALVTGFARTSAEVGAAMNTSAMSASQMVGHAEALDVRLPRIAGLLAQGRIDWPTARLVITRTDHVDADLIGHLDASLADRIGSWQCWSRRRIVNAVDAAVRVIDPEAAKERRTSADNARHVSIVALPNGMAQVRGALPAPAAAVVDTRLTEMAAAVCTHDPRTHDQRRADALFALADGRALACDCGRADCPVRAPDDAAAPARGRFVVHVIAGQDTLTGGSQAPGYLEGYGVIDAEQVRQLAQAATVRLLAEPTVSAAQALRYQPSAALERWIRSRSLTCSFPGCDRRAWFADIDHTVAFNHARPSAGGPTAPWNLDCKCRQHHRLKTFHGGPRGWQDAQLPDGTVLWTSPTGRVYRSTPAGADLFDQMRPACGEPVPRRRSRRREKAARTTLARAKLTAQRPLNAEQRRINRARRDEIDIRTWRNDMRKTLLILKGGKPSTSPWCDWVNDPLEDEHITADWTPPPTPPTDGDDEPPF